MATAAMLRLRVYTPSFHKRVFNIPSLPFLVISAMTDVLLTLFDMDVVVNLCCTQSGSRMCYMCVCLYGMDDLLLLYFRMGWALYSWRFECSRSDQKAYIMLCSLLKTTLQQKRARGHDSKCPMSFDNVYEEVL